MDNSKIQAGKIVLRISLCPVDEIIADVISQNSNEKEIIVRNRVHQPIEVDKLRIEQVLVNFVANAIKYSPGQSRVIVTAVQEHNFVKITVQDFGIGIPQEKIPYLFDRFFRVDDNSTSFSGLGLGLYISAEIIKLHHGEYGVVSEEGKGSTFWFTVPVTYAES